MLQLMGVVLIGTLLVVLVRKYAPEQGYMLSIVVVGGILLLTMSALGPIITYLNQLAAAAQLDSTLFGPLLKAVGIAIVIRITTELCKDAKELGIAATVEIGGAILVLYVSMPLFASVLQLIQSLL